MIFHIYNSSCLLYTSKTAAEIDGTSIGLKEGEQFKVEELLLGLILESGNDCAIALAEHVAGSIEEFAKLMNEKAKEIGCLLYPSRCV